MALNIEISKQSILEQQEQVLVGIFSDNAPLHRDVTSLDKANSNIISTALKNKKFKAGSGSVMTFTLPGKTLTLLGLGKKSDYSLRGMRKALAVAARTLRSQNTSRLSIHVASIKPARADITSVVEKITTALHMSLYRFLSFKTKDLDKLSILDKISLMVEGKELRAATKALEQGTIIAEAITKTRDLINTPPNVATPIYVADYAKKLAYKNKLSYSVLDEKQLIKKGMGCFMAVGQGSSNKPRMVVLEYKGKGKDKPLVLVGKGITFDTGGVNLKPTAYINNMKDDKGGACAILHVIEACARLQLKINVTIILALAENMISGDAYRPDDVLTSYSGQTVEVINTDAEGRMVLADALAYALEFKPKSVIDIATLTGASIIALGYVGSPVLGTDQKLVDKVLKAADASLDRMWQMPLWEEYNEIIKSDIADMKHLNDNGANAGVQIGAVFLKQFVKDVSWAHLDIGNTVWSKQSNGLYARGASGFGVSLLIDVVRQWK